jgi:hypothetical protein
MPNFHTNWYRNTMPWRNTFIVFGCVCHLKRTSILLFGCENKKLALLASRKHTRLMPICRRNKQKLFEHTQTYTSCHHFKNTTLFSLFVTIQDLFRCRNMCVWSTQMPILVPISKIRRGHVISTKWQIKGGTQQAEGKGALTNIEGKIRVLCYGTNITSPQTKHFES